MAMKYSLSSIGGVDISFFQRSLPPLVSGARSLAELNGGSLAKDLMAIMHCGDNYAQ
jgi:hypothetical protein